MSHDKNIKNSKSGNITMMGQKLKTGLSMETSRKVASNLPINNKMDGWVVCYDSYSVVISYDSYDPFYMKILGI